MTVCSGSMLAVLLLFCIRHQTKQDLNINVNKINREPVRVSKRWPSVRLLHFQQSRGMPALEPADGISPLRCKALDVPRRQTFLYVLMREYTEFALNADWRKHDLAMQKPVQMYVPRILSCREL